jgi:hypothetical protein
MSKEIIFFFATWSKGDTHCIDRLKAMSKVTSGRKAWDHPHLQF